MTNVHVVFRFCGLMGLLTAGCGQQTPPPSGEATAPPPVTEPLSPPSPVVETPAPAPTQQVDADLNDPRVKLALEDFTKISDVAVEAFWLASKRMLQKDNPDINAPVPLEAFQRAHAAQVHSMKRSLGSVTAVYDAVIRIHRIHTEDTYFEIHYHHNGRVWNSTDLFVEWPGPRKNYYAGKFLGGESLKPLFDAAVKELLPDGALDPTPRPASAP